ncbi:flavin reductase family protein [Cryobacterium sp. CG_9.6]|uniref:flavin reductase family protein n=1 Tax=Cryobacterium sp. CG_9.6 TaxID=2760710 RepID=UPI0024747BBC|nr:flavin reductase family protein [Cryobacterium sp. CG_9.6]MDH6235469.1 flavin reductase (DIM6/NTAB) family NADH-FMN oxidoreductase RutF [Cryobacterium sp. CG_9.6]
MRTHFDPSTVPPREFYRLLTSVVVPRPIAWVSSTSSTGVHNLAPHSFFTVASVDPPIIMFTSVGEKDTLRNIEATQDFVVNFSPVTLMAEINATGTAFDPEVSEFDRAGLTREPSLTVATPRVKESPSALECRLHEIIRMGDSTLVFGLVTHAVVNTDVLDGNHPRIDLLDPISRLGRDEWGTLGTVKQISRIRTVDWPGDFRARPRAES